MKLMPGACLAAIIAAAGLVGRCAAKPPDLPNNPTIIVKWQQYAPSDFPLPVPIGSARPEDARFGASPEVQFHGTVVWEPAPMPTPVSCGVLPAVREALTCSLLFNVHPLLSLMPSRQIAEA